jgi:hypothetical protein
MTNEEITNAQNILVLNPQENIPFRRPRLKIHIEKDNIMNLGEIWLNMGNGFKCLGCPTQFLRKARPS